MEQENKMTAPRQVLEPLFTADEADKEALWNQEAKEWHRLNKEAWGNQHFTAITTKALYVIGIIYTICRSVDVLLDVPDARENTYIPAYGVFASGVEILGRCLRGHDAVSGAAVKNLKAGFRWLKALDYANYATVKNSDVLVKTSSDSYTIDILADMRHFANHGHATTDKEKQAPYTLGEFDFEILGQLRPLLISGLERYWWQVNADWGANQDLCTKLGKANILAFRNWPVKQILRLFEWDPVAEKYYSLTEVFSRFDDWYV
jgi:hypothetical protein